MLLIKNKNLYMNYEGVVLVGGKGSRLKELTKKTAKPLISMQN